MVVKLSSLSLSRRIPNWVSHHLHFSSSSSAIKLRPTREPDQTQSDPTAFESKIHRLKNKPCPGSLVSALDTTPALDSSLKLFKWASLQKGSDHTTDAYHTVILKLGMAGNVEEMEAFCGDMVRDKCRDFDKSLSTLIDAFVGNRRLCEALRVLRVWNSSSVKPSVGSFNALMVALVEGKRGFKDVLFVYKEMVKSGVVPNIDTRNCLLEALFEFGRVDLAMDQYKRMERKGCFPNAKTFRILISGLAARSRVEESIMILRDMLKCGCEPDSSFYSCVIPIFCSLHNLEIGLMLFKMMRASDIAPDPVTYEAVIRCLCVQSHLDDAIKLCKEMVDSCGLLPDHQVYVDIVNALCELNRLPEAKNLIEELNIKDACSYNALLESYCDSGNFVYAKNTFHKMLEGDTADARSWNILIRYLCENSLTNKALEYLCRMIISSFPPDSSTYSALILGNCKMGNVECALDLFSHMQTESWVLDSVSYAEFVECLCKKENLQAAVEAFCYMSDKGCSLQSFSVLIEKICAGGEINRALKLLSLAQCTGTVSLVATYNNILTGLCKCRRENDIFVVLSRMIVAGCDFDARTYCILIQCMSGLDRKDDCISIFNLMLSRDLVPSSQTIACLLSCLAKYSQLHLIFPSIDKLLSKSDEMLDSAMYNLLVDGLWREGYKNEASHLLDSMFGKGWVPDASTHGLLISGKASNKVVGKISKENNNESQDYVSCILEQGLGQT